MTIHVYGLAVSVPAKLSVPVKLMICAAWLACAVPVPTASAQVDPQVETLTLSASLPSHGRLGGVTVDPAGNIYVSNFSATVWKVTPDGTVSPLSSSLLGSSGNAIDREGRLLQASFVDGRIVRFEADGEERTIVDEGLDGPVGIAVDQEGRIHVCNCRGNSVSVVEEGEPVRTLATGALFECPNGITVGPDGTLFVVNYKNAHVVRLTRDGQSSVLATLPGGGNAHVARIGRALYVTKIADNRLYRVDLDGEVELVAGTGDLGVTDGPALGATLARPNGIAATPDGRYLIMNNLVGPWKEDKPTEIVLRRIGPFPSAATMDATGESYRRARQVLNSVVDTLGRDAVRTFPGMSARYEGVWFARGQSPRPGPPYERQSIAGDFLYEDGGRVLTGKTLVNPGGTDRSYRRMLAEDSGWNLWIARDLLSRLPAPELQRFRGIPTSYVPRALPHSLVRMALANPSSLRWLGGETDDETAVGRVSFAGGDGATLTLVVDLGTGLPMAVERMVADGRRGDVAASVHFSDYRQVGGLRIPHQLGFFVGSEPAEEWTLSDVEVKAPEAAVFERPDDFDFVEYTPSFRPQAVGEGVYAVRLYSGAGNTYNTLLVELADGVVVIEPALVDLLAPPVTGIAGRLASGKAVKWVVATHHHSDHIGGVRGFLALGATVLTTPDGAAIAREMVEASSGSGLAPGPKPGPEAIERIVEVRKRHTLGQGSRRVELYDVGPTAHAEQILIAYVPHAKTVFVSDLFAVPDSRVFPPPSELVEHFAEVLDKLGLEVETIVPGHGLVGTPEDLARALGQEPA